MKFIGINICLLLMGGNGFPGHDVSGSYTSFHGKMIDIQNNGTFKITISSCTLDFIFSGTWYLSNDTLITCPEKMYTSRDKDTHSMYVYKPEWYTERFLVRENQLLHLTWRQIDHNEPFPYTDTLSKIPVLNNRGKLRHVNNRKKQTGN